jgi:hypothetical protein
VRHKTVSLYPEFEPPLARWEDGRSINCEI